MMDTKAEKKVVKSRERAREIIAKYYFYQIAPRSHALMPQIHLVLNIHLFKAALTFFYILAHEKKETF